MTVGQCPHCTSVAPAGARFCGACGSPLTAPGPGAAEHVPERVRFVTVLFCDVAGSTELAAALSPDVWAAILARYFTVAGRLVAAEGGRVEKFIGDAVVAVFGTDAAREDDAARAVRAAVALRTWIQGEGEAMRRSRAIVFAARMGLASGRAALSLTRSSSFAIGAVLNRAARLQAAGEVGDIVLDARTWLLVRSSVRATPLGTVSAKGFHGGVRGWRVAGDEPEPDEPQPVFVGREDLVASIADRLRDALAGRDRGPVLVSGDAGIGKSRLLDRCWETVTAGGPYADRIVLRCTERDGSHLGLRSLLVLEALIREVAGADDGMAVPATRTLAEVRWQIRGHLAVAVARRPLLLVVEDVQWAAPALLDLLDDLARQPVPSFALAVTGRTVPDAPALAATGLHVGLLPLSPEDCHRLAEALAGDVELHGGTTTLDEMIAVSRGNPLYLTQLLTLATEADGAADLFPPSAEAVVGARVDRLTVAAQQVLALLGAFGPSVAVADLAAVAADLGSDLDGALAELELQRFVRIGDGVVAGRLPVAADVAYRRLRLVDRAAVHDRIVATLGAQVTTEPAGAELVAHHAVTACRAWEQSDPGAPAAVRAKVAARRALCAAARFAVLHSEVPLALRHLEVARAIALDDSASAVELAAVEAYARLVAGQPTAALAVADAALAAVDPGEHGSAAADLLLTTALTRAMVTGVRDDALVARACDLAHAGGEPAAVSRALLFESFESAAVGDYATAQRALDRSARYARRAVGCLSTADTYGNLALCLAYGDEPAAEALAGCRRLVAEAGGAPALRAALSCPIAHLLHMLGRAEEAAAAITAAYAACAGIGHRPGLAGVLMFRAGLAQRAGDLAGAAADLTAMARLCDEMGLHDAARSARLRLELLTLLRGTVPSGLRLGGGVGWADVVLTSQVGALRTGDSRLLREAFDVLGTVRGAGAVLLPLANGVRVARRLGAHAMADRWRAALDVAARTKGDVVLGAGRDGEYP